MTLDTATALAEMIDGQIKYLWTAIGMVAAAQIAILRAALKAADARRSAKIWAGVGAVFIVVSYLGGYAAASGLVTLVMEAGAAEAAASDDVRNKLETGIEITLSTVEVFIAGQAVALIVATAATAISFLMNRDLLGEMIDESGDSDG